MKWKSQLVSELRGSMGGLTATHDQGGPWFRGRVHITQPNSRRQNRQRTVITNLNQAWQALHPSQRLAWSDYAAAVPTSEQRAVPIYADGLRHFIRSNVVRLRLGMPMVRDAPTNYSTGYAATPSPRVDVRPMANDIVVTGRTGFPVEPEAQPVIYTGKIIQRRFPTLGRPDNTARGRALRLVELQVAATWSPGAQEFQCEIPWEFLFNWAWSMENRDAALLEGLLGMRLLHPDGRVSHLETTRTYYIESS